MTLPLQTLTQAERALALDGKVIGMDSPVSFANTGVPLISVGVAAILLPFLLIPKDTRSHTTVAKGMILCAILLAILSAALLVVFDLPFAQIAAKEAGLAATAQHYLTNSRLFALVWVPLLVLIWVSRAMRVEKLKGEDMAREGRE